MSSVTVEPGPTVAVRADTVSVVSVATQGPRGVQGAPGEVDYSVAATAAQGAKADTALQSTAIGATVQPFNSALTNWALKAIPAGVVVGDSDTQTLSNKELVSPTITGTGTAAFGALSGATITAGPGGFVSTGGVSVGTGAPAVAIGQVNIYSSSVQKGSLNPAGLRLFNTQPLSWSSTASSQGTADTIVQRLGAGRLGIGATLPPDDGSTTVQVNGSLSGTTITASTGLVTASGSAGAPSLAPTAAPTRGFYYSPTQGAMVATANGAQVAFKAGLLLPSTQLLGWYNSASLDIVGSTDLTLARDAANTLAQRNGTAAQTLRVYNTYTDPSNNEFVELKFASNVAILNSTKAGTGASRELRLQYGGSSLLTLGSTTPIVWGINPSGHLVAAHNTYDIGTSTSAAAPRNINAGSAISAGTFIKPGSFTVATLPSASASGAGACVWCSDASGGSVLVTSNGTDWKLAGAQTTVT